MKVATMTAVLIASMAMAPHVALAQDAPPSARNMQGSPNANGFGKDQGIDKTSPVVGTAGTRMEGTDQSGSPAKMSGSPNANGYGK